jgi:hypothetical protein
VEFEFSGEIIEWRGPAPYYYVPLPEDESDDIQAVATAVTYGWGVIPVRARIGGTDFVTSLFPKDGRYLLPLKVVVRRAEGLDRGDTVRVRLSVSGP